MIAMRPRALTPQEIDTYGVISNIDLFTIFSHTSERFKRAWGSPEIMNAQSPTEPTEMHLDEKPFFSSHHFNYALSLIGSVCHYP